MSDQLYKLKPVKWFRSFNYWYSNDIYRKRIERLSVGNFFVVGAGGGIFATLEEAKKHCEEKIMERLLKDVLIPVNTAEGGV